MRKVVVCVVGASLGIATLTSIASAQSNRERTESPELQPPRPPLSEYPDYSPRSRWYGWQTLAADVASLTLYLGSFALETRNGEAGHIVRTVGAVG